MFFHHDPYNLSIIVHILNVLCVYYQTRPTPPHLTSAMAENILAAACESESRKAAKRMRMDVYQAHVSMLVMWNSFGVSVYFKTKLAWYIYSHLSFRMSRYLWIRRSLVSRSRWPTLHIPLLPQPTPRTSYTLMEASTTVIAVLVDCVPACNTPCPWQQLPPRQTVREEAGSILTEVWTEIILLSSPP